MEKTAIDWIRKELEYFREFEQFYSNNYMQIDALFNEAKEMEKQQIIEAHGSKLKKSRGVTNYEYWYNGEDYYNETFKSKLKD
jgi:hypothetical protein